MVQVFEALTKRTRPGDTVATKLTRVKDSALARRIWVDKVRSNLLMQAASINLMAVRCSFICGTRKAWVLITFVYE